MKMTIEHRRTVIQKVKKLIKKHDGYNDLLAGQKEQVQDIAAKMGTGAYDNIAQNLNKPGGDQFEELERIEEDNQERHEIFFRCR